ncbi:lipase chaperone family protein [Shewanella woodyi]|uniref:Lipase chaperone n=1 Tax=Shewanella woodyi (strain ATCC 51908 / MS32) TaxID=392500 RepID=B1KMS0_SHEWM|nr:lipase chaperone family protein [Shewanella woodyi]ACA87448.1 lipase chaperone-like protein [Shewanella woodyi ATCC 51908]
MPQQVKQSANSPLSAKSIMLLSLILALVVGGLIYFNVQHYSSTVTNTDVKIEEFKIQPEPVKEDKVASRNIGQSELELNEELRWKFDELILTHQETGQTITILLNKLSTQLDLTPEAHIYLLDLFSRYRDYKIALVEIKQTGPNMLSELNIDDTMNFIERAHQSQFDYFTQVEIEAFFSHENRYDNQAIERMAILQDSSLSTQQKQMLITHQISQMDEEEREVYEPTLQVFNIVDNLDGNSNQLNEFTPQVMERIEQLKADEQAWKLKVKEFQSFEIKSRGEFTDQQEVEEALSHYQGQHFTPNEIKRLKVYINNPELLNAG